MISSFVEALKRCDDASLLIVLLGDRYRLSVLEILAKNERLTESRKIMKLKQSSDKQILEGNLSGNFATKSTNSVFDLYYITYLFNKICCKHAKLKVRSAMKLDFLKMTMLAIKH